MTTNPTPFKVLFCFENDAQLILEIKRTDIQSDDKSLVYKWLKIAKDPEQIQTLSFRAMEALGENQVRTFAEGTLTWNANLASFHDETLLPVSADHVPARWLELIAGFLV